MSDLARYEFKRSLEALREARGGTSALSSFYIPPGTPLHAAVGRIREEMQWAGMISTPTTRKAVESNLEAMLQSLKGLREIPPNGLCLFVGLLPAAGGRTEQRRWILQPPEPVPYLKYYVDNHFFLEPLENLLKDRLVVGLVVIDRNEASVGTLRGSGVELLWTDESQVPNKHGQGGQSAARFERLTEEAAAEWFKKVSQKVTDAFLPLMLENRLGLIIVGGPGMTKEQWINDFSGDYRLKAKFVHPVDVGYTNEKGLQEMVGAASHALEGLGLVDEQKAVQRFLEALGRDTGLGAYGKEIVAQAAVYGAVDTILLSEGLEHAVLEDLAAKATATGAKVKVIGQTSEEGQILLRTFGGAAALLRYRL